MARLVLDTEETRKVTRNWLIRYRHLDRVKGFKFVGPLVVVDLEPFKLSGGAVAYKLVLTPEDYEDKWELMQFLYRRKWIGLPVDYEGIKTTIHNRWWVDFDF